MTLPAAPECDNERDPPRPSPAAVRARHAEIARHYDRPQAVRLETPDVVTWNKISPNKRRKELRVLRRLLAEAGQSTAEIDAVIAVGGAPELDADKIDTIYGFAFLFEHYKAIGAATGRHASTLQPIDATKAQVNAYLKAWHRPRKAAAKRKRYAERRDAEAKRREQGGDLDCRQSAIFVVATDRPERITGFMKELALSPAFRKPDGKQLTGNSLRKAIIVETKKPSLAAKLQITRTTENHGKEMLLIRRRPM